MPQKLVFLKEKKRLEDCSTFLGVFRSISASYDEGLGPCWVVIQKKITPSIPTVDFMVVRSFPESSGDSSQLVLIDPSISASVLGLPFKVLLKGNKIAKEGLICRFPN